MNNDIDKIKAESLSLMYRIRNLQTYICVNNNVQVDADGFPLSALEPTRRQLGPTNSDKFDALEKIAYDLQEGIRGLNYLDI